MALLTPEGVKKVFQLQRPEGRERLRRLLRWEMFDEARDPRRSILLDTLYESVIFAAGKGFPWAEVVRVVKFTEDLLRETKGRPVTEAVSILSNKLQDHKGQFNATHLLALCDYCHNTFVRHYNLYQGVLGQEQEVRRTVAHLEVCVPPPPLPLAEGTDRDRWLHEQQVAQLSAAEDQKRAGVRLLEEALRLRQENLLQDKFSELPAPQTRALQREEVENLINEAIHIQVESLKELLEYEIQTTFDILDLKLQKKTLNLSAPASFPLSVTGQPSQEDSLKFNKADKGKKAKGRKK